MGYPRGNPLGRNFYADQSFTKNAAWGGGADDGRRCAYLGHGKEWGGARRWSGKWSRFWAGRSLRNSGGVNFYDFSGNRRSII
jgi:hypothetical protein